MVDPVRRRAFPRGEAWTWIEAHAAHEGDDCLPWPYARRKDGYGSVGARGLAHREMCKRAHGEPPSPLHAAAHKCGKGHQGCVNPRHLRWATLSENQMDRVDHGTSNRGERNGVSRLTARQVLAIRARAESGEHHLRIASDLKVSEGTIRAVLKGRSWAWLS